MQLPKDSVFRIVLFVFHESGTTMVEARSFYPGPEEEFFGIKY